MLTRLGMLMQFSPLVGPLLILFVMMMIIILLITCIIFVIVQGQQAASNERLQSQARIQTSHVPTTQNDRFEEGKPTTQQVKVKICECGKWNAMDESVCWGCQGSLSPSNTQTQKFSFKTAPHCAVCSYEVNPGECISLCPACYAQGHRVHVLEYLKAKGACPACGQPLLPNQLLETIPTVTAPLDTPITEYE